MSSEAGLTGLPTPAELEILRILWRRGPSTVREVNSVQLERRRVRYTTTLKLLQKLFEKGLVRRDSSDRSHIYESVADEESIELRLVTEFADTIFDGSAVQLALRALSGQRLSSEDLEEIRRLTRGAEEGQR